VTAFVTAGAGFLLAVLWFDLMFDVQVIRHRKRHRELPDEVLASIAGYYRRVTSEARPMNRLVAAVMLATTIAIGIELAREDVPTWASLASLLLAGSAVLLAAAVTVPSAVRLGARADGADVQSRLARSIFRDHVMCAVAITGLLAIQLSYAA
jgi:ER membrane protein SH3